MLSVKISCCSAYEAIKYNRISQHNEGHEENVSKYIISLCLDRRQNELRSIPTTRPAQKFNSSRFVSGYFLISSGKVQILQLNGMPIFK